MNPIFLTSSVHASAEHIGKNVNAKENGYSLLFVDTAAEVEEGDKTWLEEDRQALVDAGFSAEDFTVTGKTKSEIEKAFSKVDVIYMSGGNTYYLLQQLKKTGAFDLLKQLVPSQKIYIGTSAGSIIGGPDIEILALGDSPEDAPELTDYTGLNFTDLSILPHWGSTHFQRDFEKLLQTMYIQENKYILLNDYQYLLIEENNYKIVDVRHD